MMPTVSTLISKRRATMGLFCSVNVPSTAVCHQLSFIKKLIFNPRARRYSLRDLLDLSADDEEDQHDIEMQPVGDMQLQEQVVVDGQREQARARSPIVTRSKIPVKVAAV